MIIRNREAIIEQLAEMLIQFDKDCNTYQTDVYLYYDEENQTAKLDTFVNVGGNSWLNDDHYTIYLDREHYDDGIFSWIQSKEEFAEILDISEERLKQEIYSYFDIGEDEELKYCDYREYIQNNDEYMEKLQEAYNDSIEDYRPDYVEKATDIMERFDEECAYREAMEN